VARVSNGLALIDRIASATQHYSILWQRPPPPAFSLWIHAWCVAKRQSGAVAPFIVAHHLAAFAEPGAYKTVAMMMVVDSMTKRNMTASLDLEATKA
jgi:hypothetical protein